MPRLPNLDNPPPTAAVPHTPALSPGQDFIIAQSLKAPKGAGVFTVQIVLNIDSRLDMDRFANALIRVTQHHPALRTGFTSGQVSQTVPFQIRLEQLNIEINNWEHLGDDEVQEYKTMFLAADRRLDFDLSTPPLFRVAILKTDSDRQLCVWTIHQSIVDDISIQIILKDLFTSYRTPQQPLCSPKHQVSRDGAETIQSHGDEIFWKEHLKGCKTYTCLPNLSARPKRPIKNRRGNKGISLCTGKKNIQIPTQTCLLLEQVAKSHSLSIQWILLAAWSLLLSHYSGKNNIIIGLKSDSRRKEDKTSTGMFTAVLPCRVRLEPSQTFSSLAHTVCKRALAIKKGRQTPINKIQSWMALDETDLPFDTFFTYTSESFDNYLSTAAGKINCTKISIIDRMPFPLVLKGSGTTDMVLSLGFDRRQYTPEYADSILIRYSSILKALGRLKDPLLNQIPLLSLEERQDLINPLLSPLPKQVSPSCLNQLFDIQAIANKTAIAIEFQGNKMSYGQLMELSNKLARLIRQHTQGKEEVIGTLMKPDYLFTAVILGILKSGSSYLILDPDEDVSSLVQSTGCRLVITSPAHKGVLKNYSRALVLNTKTLDQINSFSGKAIGSKIDPTQPAVVKILSGQKETIRINHASLTAMIQGVVSLLDLSPSERVCCPLFSSGAPQIESVFPVLMSGATLSFPACSLLADQLIDYCQTTAPEVIYVPTRTWPALSKGLKASPLSKNMRLLVLEKEKISKETLSLITPSNTASAMVINLLGPEHNLNQAIWADLSLASATGSPPLFRPLPGTSLAVLNQFMQPSVPGISGTLYIGGAHLGLDHCGDQDKSIQLSHVQSGVHFFPSPFSARYTEKDGIILTDSNSLSSSSGYFPDEVILSQPIILIGNSMDAAQKYRTADLGSHHFLHAPIFTHLHDKKDAPAMSLTISDIAARCIKSINSTYPSEPLILIGSCQNAVVAHEAALQLVKEGRQIDLLIIIDENWRTNVNETTSKIPSQRNTLKKIVWYFRRQGILGGIKAVAEKLTNRIRSWYIAMDKFHEGLYRTLGKRPPVSVQFRRMEALFYKICDANPYQPKLYSGKVQLFYSKGWIKTYSPELNTFYSGKVKREEIPIRHDEWFDPNQIQRIITKADQFCKEPKYQDEHQK